jgi:hypothetical protein
VVTPAHWYGEVRVVDVDLEYRGELVARAQMEWPMVMGEPPRCLPVDGPVPMTVEGDLTTGARTVTVHDYEAAALYGRTILGALGNLRAAFRDLGRAILQAIRR